MRATTKMIKAATRSALKNLAHLKAAWLFDNQIGPESKLCLSSDIRYSSLHGNNVVGKRSVVHKSTLGEFSYVGDDCRIINADIGMFASLGCGIKTAFGRHPYQYLSQHPATYSIHCEMPSLASRQLFDGEHSLTPDGRFVSIGHDVWIGDDVKIFDGTTIGHGAVVGANSLVTRSVPPYAVVRGSPAQIEKYRFSEPDIEALLRLQWWTWDRAALRLAVNERLFCGPVGFLDEFFKSRVARSAGTTTQSAE